MIPIKDAITIFEQHKIEQFRNSDFLKFEADFFTGDFSAPNYILSLTKQWLGFPREGYATIKQLQLKPLLSFLKKRYHRDDKEPFIDKGLPLYGKKVTYIDGKPRGSNEYEEVYKHNYYATSEQEIELDFTTGECKAGKLKTLSSNKNEQLKENPILTTLFENYDYQEIYNPSRNYTVMGNIENNVIAYMDICVDKEEFKTFLESEFTNSKSKNIALIKWENKVDEVFKLTIQKEKQLDIYEQNILDRDKFIDRSDLPAITKEDATTLDEFIHKNIKRQIKYNKLLDKKIVQSKFKKKDKL